MIPIYLVAAAVAFLASCARKNKENEESGVSPPPDSNRETDGVCEGEKDLCESVRPNPETVDHYLRTYRERADFQKFSFPAEGVFPAADVYVEDGLGQAEAEFFNHQTRVCGEKNLERFGGTVPPLEKLNLFVFKNGENFPERDNRNGFIAFINRDSLFTIYRTDKLNQVRIINSIPSENNFEIPSDNRCITPIVMHETTHLVGLTRPTGWDPIQMEHTSIEEGLATYAGFQTEPKNPAEIVAEVQLPINEQTVDVDMGGDIGIVRLQTEFREMGNRPAYAITSLTENGESSGNTSFVYVDRDSCRSPINGSSDIIDQFSLCFVRDGVQENDSFISGTLLFAKEPEEEEYMFSLSCDNENREAKVVVNSGGFVDYPSLNQRVGASEEIYPYGEYGYGNELSYISGACFWKSIDERFENGAQRLNETLLGKGNQEPACYVLDMRAVLMETFGLENDDAASILNRHGITLDDSENWEYYPVCE